MSSKRSIITAMSLVAALALPAVAQEKAQAGATAEQKAPTLTLVDPLKDFGTVAKGKKLDWSFTVKNTGTSDLEILSANPTCGCTVAEFDKVIKPGQTGKVSAHVDTANFSGPISKAVTLATNDPNSPSAQLTINAVVKPYVEASPAGFVRYTLMQGDEATQTIKIYSEDEAPFEIKKIETPGEWVKVNYNKIDKAEERVEAGRAGQTQYQVDVTYGGAKSKVGPIAEKIKIVTNSPNQPEYLVSLSGVIRPRFSLTPAILNFGEVTGGDAAANRTVLVSTNDKKAPADFKVTRVESTSGAVQAELVSLDTPGNYEVKISLDKGAKAGDLNTKVKIHTNDKLNPIVELPVKALVKKAAATTK